MHLHCELVYTLSSRLEGLKGLLPAASCFQDKENIYKVSVSSLFIFAIRDETLRSIVLSPISTIRPPTISGLTYCPYQLGVLQLPAKEPG
jgi:hypothetical protein